VFILPVSSLLCYTGKGLGAQVTLYVESVLVMFFFLMAGKRACSTLRFLTALTMHVIGSGDGELSLKVFYTINI